MSEKADGNFVLVALLLLFGVGIFYVIYVHDWYWHDGAQIDLNYGCNSECAVGCDSESPLFITKCWWTQDAISNFLDGTLFLKYFAPAWNSFISDESHRVAFAALISILYTASAATVIKLFIDWLHERYQSRK